MFDITAPLERQRTRDGRKLAFLADTKIDTEFPILAIIEGQGTSIRRFTRKGQPISGWELVVALQTLPEQKPDKVTFLSQDKDGRGYVLSTFENAYEFKDASTINILKLTYNPNTNETSVETIWTKGSEQ